PFRIEKRQVYESYKAVKANPGAAGVDTDGLLFCPRSVQYRAYAGSCFASAFTRPRIRSRTLLSVIWGDCQEFCAVGRFHQLKNRSPK
ncbi:hypothetical protein BMJ31_21755, partial [Sinorhizobium medicae]